MLCYVMLDNVCMYVCMYCYVLLCIVMYCYVLLCIVMYCYVFLCIVMYCYVLLCIVMYCYVLLCIFMLLLCIVMYCYVLLCIVMYCYVLLCIVMYCYVLLCIVMYCYVLLCIVMYCYVLFCIAMLCYVMSCHVMYVVLCHVMLCCVVLCYVMLCYVMLCIVMYCFVLLCYVMLCHVMLCMLCYAMLCYVVLCCVMLCYVMLCYVLFCIVLYCIVVYCIVLYCIVLYCMYVCSFETITQYILLPQSDGQLCLLKHVYITNEKVSGSYVAALLHGNGREIAWGNGNKQVVRKAFQWMLEQLGGTQFQKFILTPEKKKKKKQALASQAPEEEGWTFLWEHGELDKSDLKQLRWIHFHINRDDSPIKGWQERLVQKALDSLANDSTIAKLCERYDLTISDVDPEVRSLLEIMVPHLWDHALWLLGITIFGVTLNCRKTYSYQWKPKNKGLLLFKIILPVL